VRSRSIVLPISGLLTGVAAATSSAAADDLVVNAPGAQQLAAGERHLAWMPRSALLGDR